MANVDFELDLAGLNELMKSSEMQAALKEAGGAVANVASGAYGEEYGTETRVLSFVAIQNVYPATKAAAIDNYRHNTLVTAAGATGLTMQK